MEEFDFIGPNDQPALLAITTPEVLQTAKTTLSEMGYKVHVVETHPQFETRYNQVNYQVVIIEETFAGGSTLDNPSLQMVQGLSMNQRRYATFFLIGPAFESLNTLQAFAQSVHCVMNPAELQMLSEVVQKTIAENDLFLSTFREVQRRVYQKGA
jgi:hypothetical protein